MADHYFSLKRTADLKPADITVGTSSTSGDPIELRVTDSAIRRKDVLIALTVLAVFLVNPKNASLPWT